MNMLRFLSVLVFGLSVAVASIPLRAEGEGGATESEPSGSGGGSGADEGSGGDAAHPDHGDSGAGGANTNPLSVDPDLAICTAIVFFLLLAILWLFAWGPIMEGLSKREQSISDNIDEAKQGAEKASAMLKQYENKLSAAQDEVKALLTEARKEAELTKEQTIAEAKEGAQRERDRAIDEIRVAKEAAVSELAQSVVNDAVALTGRMLSREVDSNAHSDLIKEALDQFPSQN